MLGINISEQCHIVNAIPPIDSAAGAQTGAVINMEGYAHASIIVQLGAANADAGFITLEESDTAAFTNHPEVAFYYYSEITPSGDVLDTGPTTAVAATGIDIPDLNETFYVIEFDSSQFTAGYSFIIVMASIAGGANLISAVAILSGPRYMGYGSGSVLT
jgi:hypothetical protein